ncbi:MAG TPA: calcium/proton exchanger [Solirubrobacteraceae bacterium]|nr:calcium/proton exchanger [Solirubrobacteraceae bacterium]
MRSPAAKRPKLAAFLLTGGGWPYLLTPFIPAAVALELSHAGAVGIFVSSALGVVPTAALMGRATEELAARSGSVVGGLLNVTFGNAPELIIAFVALGEGLHEVVKASLVGSMLGNVLLVLGAALTVGGLRNGRQRFDRNAAVAQSSLLLAGAAAFALPAVLALAQGDHLPSPRAERVSFGSTLQVVSLVIAAVLIACYVVGLLRSLRQTGGSAAAPTHMLEQESSSPPWSTRRSVTVLALAGMAVALMSEILVGSVAATARQAGLSQFFIGAIVVAIVGNAAEHWVAVLVAARNKLDLAIAIAVGSSVQIGLAMVPLLVIASFFVGPSPMALVINGYELGGVLLAAVLARAVAGAGTSTWRRGALLLGCYVALGVAFALVSKTS